MALDALAEVAGAALRLCGRIVFEIVVEWLIYGTGRLLLWPFYRRKPPGDTACLCAGLGFWLLVLFAVASSRTALNA